MTNNECFVKLNDMLRKLITSDPTIKDIKSNTVELMELRKTLIKVEHDLTLFKILAKDIEIDISNGDIISGVMCYPLKFKNMIPREETLMLQEFQKEGL